MRLTVLNGPNLNLLGRREPLGIGKLPQDQHGIEQLVPHRFDANRPAVGGLVDFGRDDPAVTDRFRQAVLPADGVDKIAD